MKPLPPTSPIVCRGGVNTVMLALATAMLHNDGGLQEEHALAGAGLIVATLLET